MSKRSSSASQSQQSKKTKTQQSLSGFFSTSKSSSDDATTTTSSSSSSQYKIFCDLDGVLVDFDAGVKKLFNGRSPDELPNQGMMWGGISKAEKFYARLPWTADGKALWEELKNNHPTTPDILTGVPRTLKSRGEKFAWCKANLGISVNHVDMAGKKSAHELVTGRRKNGTVNVITCWSKNKHCESKENHILIDDRLSLREAWEERGGTFIHHISTERTLSMLRQKGVLPETKNKNDNPSK
eukprot:CAMPEP_0172304280 /NCGR_PEP_ID=MMETSP1058-20130122/5704_1 /TAXON_ID=83371 /ORGANISM="Detonula confervacea, Strain CCMP 353" /LENGTH=240 /DNA_ID=CAMNT_0013015435 /DNA_START=71 /DNA_END=793 /DNA_ORIENTATION=+